MPQLTAETHIAHHTIGSVMQKLRDEHGDHAVDTGVDGQWHFQMHYGALSVALADRSASIRVFAEDETCLSYMKMIVAGHVSEHLGTTQGIRWQGDGTDAGIPVFFREIAVVSSSLISAHMRRVRFAAADLDRFARGGLHVRLLLPPRDRRPVWPSVGADGLLVWPAGEDALVVRVYTIRAIDAASGWVDVDFVVHEGIDTPASTFAETARPGDVIGMIGPGGGDLPDVQNLLLLGDDTALPAIQRMLGQLPPTSRVEVFVEVDGPADVLPFMAGDNIRVTWLYREGREAGTTKLLSAALSRIDPATLPADVYVWAGCEFADFREIRNLVRKQWGLGRDRQMIVAYWRRGAQGEDGDE
jgi:NADPH-dependent ferric siderophore reductase